MQSSNIIIGCGDLGKRIAKQLINRHEAVLATSHQESSQKILHNFGIQTISADLDTANSLSNINFQHANVYYLLPPPSDGISDTRMSNFITTISHNLAPRRIVYISTTGVYGDAQGEWITEKQPANPQTNRGKRRLDAEQQLISFCAQSSCEYNILRVSGIYCLNKLPLERLKAGVKALDLTIAPSSNRIHAKDLTTICLHTMRGNSCNQIFNAADGKPSSITDYFIKVANTFNLPQPQQISWQDAQTEVSSAMLSYLAESKKISIEKIKETFNFEPQYPDLETGLQQCHREYKQNTSTRV